MASLVRVCAVGDVPTEGAAPFDVDGLAVPVMVARRVDGAIAVFGSECPHEGISMEDGDCERDTISCPGHAYEFSVRTGACLHDPDLSIPIYPVVIDDSGWVCIDIAAGIAGMLGGVGGLDGGS